MTEMCLLHEKGCNLEDRIAYASDHERLEVTGSIYYQNLQDAFPNYKNDIQQWYDVRNFIVMDNFQYDLGSTFGKETQKSVNYLAKKHNATAFSLSPTVTLNRSTEPFNKCALFQGIQARNPILQVRTLRPSQRLCSLLEYDQCNDLLILIIGGL
ncbi:hypothetical protein FGO68_gene3172 [Halteria grandinella]|uniref:Uncharacterized protein n=1 Tax=Halteria grandinella TaxID=5974 RepID=A0A8J8T0A7_HALGN|nr:hypothetical protein FGO68_gene3172 [Halteria grandinella]